LSAPIKAIGPLGAPDDSAAGLVEGHLDPLRYGGQVLDPDEVSGIVTCMIPTGARVLEVGCGTGSMSQIVRDTCQADVVGIEPDPARARRAADRGLRVHTGFLSLELIHEVGPFDVVLFADVLEHVPNPHRMLIMSHEALKPGGAVIVSVPNVAHWSVRVDLIRGRFRYEPSGIMDATHLRWFTAETARSLVESAGFRVVDYRASVCQGEPFNVERRPLRWLSPKQRMSLLRFGCKHWPTLFGCQHVLKAEML
jgi:methionine biosynthesis protein MetW